MNSPGGASKESSSTHTWIVAAVLGATVAATAILVWQSTRVRGEFGTAWGLMMGGDPEPLRSWLFEFGAWAPLLSGLLYVLSALIPVLPGFVLAIANAMLFGAFWGGLISFVSATVAAAACFGLARTVGRPGVLRIVSRHRLERMDRFMDRHGLLAVFLGRLIPFINPDVLSYAAGVTGIRWIPFLLAMAAGALPATIVYSLVGGYAIQTSGWVVVIVTAATLIPLVVLWFYRDRIPGLQRSEED